MKFLRLFHQTQCFAISFRRRHTKVSRNIFFCGPSFLLSNHRNRTFIQICDSTYRCSIIIYMTVSVKFFKITEDFMNVIQCRKSLGSSCRHDTIPGGHFSFFLFLSMHDIRHICCRNSIRGSFLCMHMQQTRQGIFHILTADNPINETVFHQELCPLKTFWQLLSNRLLNDAGTGKAYQCPRLCQDNIAQHGETCRHSTGSRISKHRNI